VSAPLGRCSTLSRRGFVQQVASLTALALFGACAAPDRTAPNAPRVRRIGYLSSNSSASVKPNSEIFMQALQDLGYVEGRDIMIDFRIAESVIDRLPGLAAELVALPVDVVLAETGAAAEAAKPVTGTTPVVFVLVPDPVGQGLVASLARPGGSYTGVTTLSGVIAGKRLELLKETVPGLARVAVLWNPTNPPAAIFLRGTEEAAGTLGLETKAFSYRSGAELDAALETIARGGFDGLVMLTSVVPPADTADFAAEKRLPAIYASLDIARAGGLMSLGVNTPALFRKAAGLVDKILKGARPADLPIEHPTQIDFVVNIATAKRLGLAIPDNVLRQATEVIR